MPGLNHRGPEGEGPRTGRGLGNCGKPSEKQNTDSTHQAQESTPGRGLARGRGKASVKGRGLGRGLRNGRGFGFNR